jgi:hypothetical protein
MLRLRLLGTLDLRDAQGDAVVEAGYAAVLRPFGRRLPVLPVRQPRVRVEEPRGVLGARARAEAARSCAGPNNEKGPTVLAQRAEPCCPRI